MKTVGQEFIEQAMVYPTNNALFVDDKYYTYFELLGCVQGIYQLIRAQGVDYNRIGIFCTNDLITYASILAVSIYGATYVPLNSSFPSDKNQDLINASEIELLIHNDAVDLSFDLSNASFLPVNIDINNVGGFLDDNFGLDEVVNQQIAYILFTSGTTGIPKAVAITKENLNSFFDFFEENSAFQFNEKDRFIQAFELTFDVSVFSFFMPLKKGACCYIVPQHGFRFLEILKMLKEKKITVATMVPTFLSFAQKYFNQLQLPDLKYSLFIGDKLSKKLTEKWEQVIPHARIINFYGPTEATVMCSFFVWDEFSKNQSLNDVVPIGDFFNEVVFEIINPTQENGLVIGELCLFGNQVISKYLNDSYQHKFIEIENKRFYRTGDLVSINDYGNLNFHGRIDSQVKINGFRVELNEIEEAILQFSNERFALICFENEEGVKKIILFIERFSDNECAYLHNELRTVLPEYMIPSEIIPIQNIPLNSNSKIDLVSLKNIYQELNKKN